MTRLGPISVVLSAVAVHLVGCGSDPEGGPPDDVLIAELDEGQRLELCEQQRAALHDNEAALHEICVIRSAVVDDPQDCEAFMVACMMQMRGPDSTFCEIRPPDCSATVGAVRQCKRDAAVAKVPIQRSLSCEEVVATGADPYAVLERAYWDFEDPPACRNLGPCSTTGYGISWPQGPEFAFPPGFEPTGAADDTP
jgi:hypothetical protein